MQIAVDDSMCGCLIYGVWIAGYQCNLNINPDTRAIKQSTLSPAAAAKKMRDWRKEAKRQSKKMQSELH